MWCVYWTDQIGGETKWENGSKLGQSLFVPGRGPPTVQTKAVAVPVYNARTNTKENKTKGSFHPPHLLISKENTLFRMISC